MYGSTVFILILIVIGVKSDDSDTFMGVDYESVFDQDLYKSILDPIKCEQQLNLLQMNLSLAMPFIDASGKIPSGIMLGNHAELGSYYQCLNIEDDATDMGLEGKYCMIEVSVPPDIFNAIPQAQYFTTTLLNNATNDQNQLTTLKKQISLLSGIEQPFSNQYGKVSSKTNFTIKLSWGVCIPKACRPLDVVNFISSKNFPLAINSNYYRELFCRVPNDKPYSPSDYVAFTVFSLLALITIASTSYDLYHVFILHSDKSQISTLYRCFSIYTNTKRFVTFNKVPGALECMDGIRAISMLWVIVGHTYSMTMMTSVYNMTDVLKWMTSLSSIWINSAPLSVDTFFTLSGLLCVYTVIGKIQRQPFIKSLHFFYLYRLLRLFPLLAAVVLLQASVFHRISDGPMWSGMATMVSMCRRRWWSTLLHVQNYVRPFGMCLYHTWYLSVDIQLYILTPLVLVWLFGRKTVAWCALTAAVMISLALTSTSSFTNNYPAATINLRSNDGMQDYFLNYYMNTMTRASPFCIGMLYGYILHLFRGKIIQMHKALVSIGWILTFILMGFCIFIIYPVLQLDHDNQLLDNFLNAYMRSIWAVALGWLIVACVHGYGGPVNWFLSLAMWKLPSRLSYAMYLLHFPIINIADGSMVSTYYFTDGNTIYRAMGDLGFTIIASFILSIIVDAPFSTLQKMLQKRGKQTSGKSTAQIQTDE